MGQGGDNVFCSACGIALAQRTKYCNRCGAQLITTNEAAEIDLIEKRMDSEMEGLFWITVFGMALIVGGMVLMKKVQLNEWLIVAYMALSSAAFVSYFGLTVWQVRRLSKKSNEVKGIVDVTPFEMRELNPAKPLVSLDAPSSVTEHTTRTLEVIHEERDKRLS
jgi:hypothetical protein